MIFTDGMDVVDANRETLTDHWFLMKAQSFREPSKARSMKLCDPKYDPRTRGTLSLP
ncbi:hypothetical protein [Paenibacillus lautus]|uniref:hypothetical protein n=1 Tax=Paenibacillus lautus TaxID=1401 RepID=UPI003D9A8C1F